MKESDPIRPTMPKLKLAKKLFSPVLRRTLTIFFTHEPREGLNQPRGALILQIVFEVIQAASFLPVY